MSSSARSGSTRLRRSRLPRTNSRSSTSPSGGASRPGWEPGSPGSASTARGTARSSSLHTEVDPDFEGKGFGSKLAAAVLADVTGRELRVIVRCPFISAYVRRHRADYPGIELEREREPAP